MRSVLETVGLKRRATGISERAKATTVSPIKEMALIADQIEGAVSLGWGLPSFETPAHIIEAVRRSLAQDRSIGKYPHIRGLPELRQAIAARFAQQWDVSLDPEREILVTVGAQQALFSALLTIVDPGDEVILMTPCFSSYIDQVLLAGGVPVYVNLAEAESWQLNVEEVKKKVSPRTKAIILNSPVNPTGSVFQEMSLRGIGDLAIQYNFFVLTDETYNFLRYDDAPYFNLFSIPSLRDHLIGCYSFSKEYAMTGWRVGYLCAEGGLIEEMLKIHDASVITAPRVSQMAALAALQGPQDCVQQFTIELHRRRGLICSRLDRLSRLFSYVKPLGAYYVFPKLRIPNVDSFQFAVRLLKEARVVTIPGDAFGPGGKGHLRLCFAMQKEEIGEAFDRLEQFALTSL